MFQLKIVTQKFCRLKKSKDNDSNQKLANVTKESKKSDFMFHSSEINNEAKDIWLLDSGASNHVCCNKEMFVSMKPSNSSIL